MMKTLNIKVSIQVRVDSDDDDDVAQAVKDALQESIEDDTLQYEVEELDEDF